MYIQKETRCKREKKRKEKEKEKKTIYNYQDCYNNCTLLLKEFLFFSTMPIPIETVTPIWTGVTVCLMVLQISYSLVVILELNSVSEVQYKDVMMTDDEKYQQE